MLTMSKIMAGLQCPKRLWLLVHRKNLVAPVDSTAIRQGSEVDRVAMDLYPGGVMIDAITLQHGSSSMSASALGLDIDGTISSAPDYFSTLSRTWVNAGKTVQIISSRSDSLAARVASLAELRGYRIAFHALHLLPSVGRESGRCPHPELDWFQAYLWQKVALARQLGVVLYFDDDEKVVRLFRRFAPEIYVVHAGVDDLPAVPNLLRLI